MYFVSHRIVTCKVSHSCAPHQITHYNFPPTRLQLCSLASKFAPSTCDLFILASDYSSGVVLRHPGSTKLILNFSRSGSSIHVHVSLANPLLSSVVPLTGLVATKLHQHQHTGRCSSSPTEPKPQVPGVHEGLRFGRRSRALAHIVKA